VDAVAVDGSHFDDGGKCGLSGGRGIRHDRVRLGSVGVMEGARVVFAEPRVLEGVGAIDFVCIQEEEPEMVEGLVRDEFKLRESVLVGDGSSEVGDEGFVGGLGDGGRPHRGGGVVETSWHC
jgi:hypothetical protein